MSFAAARLVLDLDAVAANWRTLQATASRARCAAVVKANAYGLGAAPVASRLYAEGCRTFFVAHLDEGLLLRQTLPAPAQVLVLNGLIAGSEAACADAGLLPVLNSPEQVAAWHREARRRGCRLPAALQVDTGMQRLGLQAADWQALQAAPQQLDGIDLRLLISHLASAECPGAPSNRQQLQRFRQLRAALPQVPASLANSAGILLAPDFHFDLVRPGAALYGIAPRPDLANLLQPVVRVQARIVQCREVAAGVSVGYNGTWCARRRSRIATVAAGYADGYPRALGNQASVGVAGHRAPVVGHVSMDTLTIDVTDVPPDVLARAGWCDLIDAHSTVNLLAAQSGSSAYALLTGLGHRFERLVTATQAAQPSDVAPVACPACPA